MSNPFAENDADEVDIDTENAENCPEYARFVALYDTEKSKILGRGSMAIVRQIKRRSDGISVAVKVLPKKLATEGLREAKNMAQIQCPDVLHLCEVFCCEKTVLIVTELASGGDLFSYISAHNWLSDDVTRQIAKRLLRGVSYLHSLGIVHRDLKPQNILLATNNPTDVRIADFGVAKMVRDDSFLKTMCGSPHYLGFIFIFNHFI